MTNKSVAIIIDDFSDRVFEYNNVTVYDYGSLTITNSHDYFYNTDSSFDGYGVNSVDSDYIETLYFHENDFFKITPTYNSNFDYIDDFLDIDVINLTVQQQALYNLFGTDVFQDVYASSIAQDSMGNLLFDYFGYPYLNTVSNNIIREGTSSTYEVCHGDWVLEAFYSSLERPELTEIICIDIDTLNGGYVNAVQYSDLFTIEDSILDPTFQATNLENIIVDFLQNKGISFAPEAVNQDMYTISGLSVSLAGSMAQEEIPSLELMEFLQAPIIQAAPNVNQGLYDWGSNYPDVINVGAWNVAANEEFLLSSLYTIDTVDIVADGYIFKNEWGSNFGTSFATPRVTAEITNAVNDYLFETNLNNETLTTIADSPAIDYSNLVNSLVGYISEPVLVNIYNDNNIYSLNVLSKTINDNGLEPVYTPTVASGLEGVLLENVQLAGLENPSDDPPPPNNEPYFTYDVDARDYFTFQEHPGVGSPIGSIFAEDIDGDELVFSITGGSGQPYFEIEKITNEWGTYGRVKTTVRDELDFDTLKDIYEIKTNIPNNPGEHVILDLEISVSDGYSVVSRTVYAGIFNNVSDDPVPNQAPTNIYLNDNTGPVSVSENLEEGFIANLSGYDPEGDNLTYSVLSDYDGDMLEVNGTVLKFKDGVAADYEQSELLNFKLMASNF